MTDLDTRLREALDLQASRAPQPDAVRARLEARLRARPRAVRTRRVFLPAAAAVAAAGVAATVSLLGTPASWTPAPVVGPAASSSSSSSTPVVGDPRTVPLRFSPTVLPAGLHEVSRSFVPDGVQRGWVPGQAVLGETGGSPRLDFWLDGAAPDLAEGTAVTVSGRPGHLVDGGDKILLEWKLPDGTWAALESIGTGLDAKGLIAVAASVRPDAGTAVFPLDAGFDGREVPARLVVRDTADRWLATETVVGTTVSVGTQPQYQVPGADRLPAQKLVVGGKPARFVPVSAGHPYAELVVTLGDNRFLSVAVSAGVVPPQPKNGATATLVAAQPPATRATVVSIAERVRWSEPSSW